MDLLRSRSTIGALLIAVLLTASLFCGQARAATEQGKRIVVSINDQRSYFLEDGYLVASHVVSTGRDDRPTPPGTYSIYKHQYEYYTGYVIQYYSMFFYGLYALHSVLYSPSTGQWIGVDTLGSKASNGCVRLALDDAKWAYEWAPDGTRVDIILEHFVTPPPLPAPAPGGHVTLGTGSPAYRWYFAEGCTGTGFDEFIAICNPSVEEAAVCLQVASPGESAKEGWLDVPPMSRRTVRIDELLPDRMSVSVSLRSDQPVVAERSQYFEYQDGSLGGHVTTGAKKPAPRWLFAEGSCRPWIDTYICIFNPGKAGETARVDLMTGSGEKKSVEVEVEPGSRATLDIKSVLGEGDDPAHDFSCAVDSIGGAGLVVERPMYFNYQAPEGLGWDGGDNSLGANAAAPRWYFAEGTCRPGFDAYICIQNPEADPATARVVFMLGDGTNVVRHLRVDAESRRTLRADDVLGEGDDTAHDFSLLVESMEGSGLVVERHMYFSYQGGHALNWEGGHNAMGATAPLPKWYFAEGTCRSSFDTYLTVLNPGAADSGARVVFLLGDGRRVEHEMDLPGRARRTLKVNDVLGEGDDPAHDFSCIVESTDGSGLVVERPSYFLYDRR